MTHSVVSRRDFLKALAVAGAAGAAGLSPLSALADTAGHGGDQEHDAIAPTMTETRVLMGTFVAITLAGASRGRMEDALGRAFERMDGLIAVFDRFNPASPLSVLNERGRLDGAPSELTALLDQSARVGDLTGGAFNITVQPLVDLFRRHSNPAGSMSIPAAELAEARALVLAGGWKTDGRAVRLDRQGMGLTLDGIAKGHIADEVSRFLIAEGLPNHLINAGGDIVAAGEKTPGQPWMVAVENPAAHGGFTRRMPLRDRAVATSGSYEIYYDASRRHHHLINPAAGASPVDLASATVAARNAAEADALATALSVMPPRDGLKLVASLPGRECLLLTRDGGRLSSARWRA